MRSLFRRIGHRGKSYLVLGRDVGVGRRKKTLMRMTSQLLGFIKTNTYRDLVAVKSSNFGIGLLGH